MQRVLVSACLLGQPERYDGGTVATEGGILARWQMEGRIVPMCPEMAGGLPVPRLPAEIHGEGGRGGTARRSPCRRTPRPRCHPSVSRRRATRTGSGAGGRRASRRAYRAEPVLRFCVSLRRDVFQPVAGRRGRDGGAAAPTWHPHIQPAPAGRSRAAARCARRAGSRRFVNRQTVAARQAARARRSPSPRCCARQRADVAALLPCAARA